MPTVAVSVVGAALSEENHQFIRSGVNSLKVAVVTALLRLAS